MEIINRVHWSPLRWIGIGILSWFARSMGQIADLGKDFIQQKEFCPLCPHSIAGMSADGAWFKIPCGVILMGCTPRCR
jgi:hypothetical protein